MRWAGSDACLRSLVGKALEPMDEERGSILVLLKAHWPRPDLKSAWSPNARTNRFSRWFVLARADPEQASGSARSALRQFSIHEPQVCLLGEGEIQTGKTLSLNLVEPM